MLAKSLVPAEITADEFEERRHELNNKLVSWLRKDTNSDVIMRMTLEDAELGRMSKPRLLVPQDLDDFNLSPRFCIEQGVRNDGSVKYRMVDDFTKSRVNSATSTKEKLVYDTVEDFFLLPPVRLQAGSGYALRVFLHL